MQRTLVVNADDLGLTVGVNNGIFDAHDRGILTSASLMANAPAAANAIRRARSRPTLGIGVHLTLVDGAPMLPPDRIPTLVQDDGRFHVSWRPFIVACLMGRVSMNDVERELDGADRMRGVAGHRADAPGLAQACASVSAGVRDRRPSRRSVSAFPSSACRTKGRWRTCRLLVWAHHDYRLAASQGITTPRFVGRAMTGVMTADALACGAAAASPRAHRTDGAPRLHRRRIAATADASARVARNGSRAADVTRGRTLVADENLHLDSPRSPGRRVISKELSPCLVTGAGRSISRSSCRSTTKSERSTSSTGG